MVENLSVPSKHMEIQWPYKDKLPNNKGPSNPILIGIDGSEPKKSGLFYRFRVTLRGD
jgi:hypothetical protein